MLAYYLYIKKRISTSRGAYVNLRYIAMLLEISRRTRCWVKHMHDSVPSGPCLFHGTERHGTERNAGLFHGTDKCDRGTINLILEYLTRNGLIRICKVRNDKLYY